MQIECLKHQATAIERQSSAYWDTRSVDFAEGLKTYAQKNMAMLEQARRSNKSETVEAVYLDANAQFKELEQRNIPQSLKLEIAQRIVEIRDQAIDRIMDDTLANKYDLGPAS